MAAHPHTLCFGTQGSPRANLQRDWYTIGYVQPCNSSDMLNQYCHFCMIPVTKSQLRRLQVYTNFLLQENLIMFASWPIPHEKRDLRLGPAFSVINVMATLELSPIQSVSMTCRYVSGSHSLIFLRNQLASSHQTPIPSTICTSGSELIYAIIP
ncbi:hypothetical protein BDR22DRAFT_707387 [Usnea florida]